MYVFKNISNYEKKMLIFYEGKLIKFNSIKQIQTEGNNNRYS